MRILKRNGKIEKFYIYKVRTSIENTARDCNYSLNQSDINSIISITNSRINNLLIYNENRTISSIEIKIILYEALKELGFKRIAEKYIST